MTTDAQTLVSKGATTIELDTVRDSKIVQINLYSNLAEVTRSFKIAIQAGQNNLQIGGLSNVIDKDTVRVESRGTVTIHDVSVAYVPIPIHVKVNTPEMDALKLKKSQLQNALSYNVKALAHIETFMSRPPAPKSDGVDMIGFIDSVRAYQKIAGELGNEALVLKEELAEIESNLSLTELSSAPPVHNTERRNMATVCVVSGNEKEIELLMKYSVRKASWSAAYDIRVDLQAAERPVTLTYKAAIKQSTNEPWNDVPIYLETATPTHNLPFPVLTPWTLSVYTPPPPVLYASAAAGTVRRSVMFSAKKKESSARSGDVEVEESDDDMGFALFDDGPGPTVIASQGNVNATYAIAGNATIPSDGVEHLVTVAQLKLDSTIEWSVAPKKDTRVHLKAKIKNDSDYTLFPGRASVYVDGSFISTSTIKLVSPQETFISSLGIDPSVRITYHPLSKKQSKSGLISKSTEWTYIQRITIFNTKPVSITRLHVFDQIPISQDAQIVVKLVSPPLLMPPAPESNNSTGDAGKGKSGTLRGSILERVSSTSDSKKAAGAAPTSVKVTPTVTAQWDGTEEALVIGGAQGKLYWVCGLEPQEKANLTLQFEVSAPVNVTVMGL